MLRKPALLGGVFASLIIAVVAYFWATGAIDSLYSFRSPLHDSPPAPGEAVGPALTERVVVVLVDGLRADTAAKSEVMPYLAELRRMGASATMHSRPPTFSAPSYTVLATGAWPELSDGPSLNLDYEEYTPWTQDNIFASAHRAGLSTAVSAYYWFEKLIPQQYVTAGFYTAGDDQKADRDVVAAALPWLAAREHALTLVHLDQLDYAGHHEGGALHPNWDAAAGRTDELIREMAAALDFSRDTVIVLSDHGHIDAGGHGGQDVITTVEPFVAVGKGIRPGQYADMNQVDVAPTLAALLGAALPASAQGRAVSEMLALSEEGLARLARAEATQQAGLVAAYGRAIGSAVQVDGGAGVPATQRAMDQARDARLMSERWPRIAIAAVLLLALLALVWRVRGRVTALMLIASLIYLLVFNLRYAVLDGGTYSLSSVAGQTELILYVAGNTLLALVVGWLVLVLTSGLLQRPPAAAARLTLGWTLLTTALTVLPLLLNVAWNGVLVGWTLPAFGLFFLAFLALLQALFLGVFGPLLAGLAALLARVTAWTQQRAAMPA